MIIIVAVIAALSGLTLGGLAWLAHVLRRDRPFIWHPGDPVPEVPADAAIRHWHQADRERQLADATPPNRPRRD
jgi:hypothetical protein